MEEGNGKEEKVTGDDIEKETLKPITKAKSKKDKELQEWEVESTGGGLGAAVLLSHPQVIDNMFKSVISKKTSLYLRIF